MFVGLSVGINRVAAKAGLEPGDLRRVLQVSLTATGALDVERFLSASESINLTASAALIVLRELSASPSFSLTAAGTLDAAFTPASLFASGEEGAWYEPSTTTAFRSTTDLTPCDYGQSAGFLLDLSKGAGYSGGSFTGLGSELVTNGDFSYAGDWTLDASTTISGGVANVVSGVFMLTQNMGLVSGQTYLLTLDYTETSSTALRVVSSGVVLANSVSIGGTGSGSISLTFVANSASISINASGSAFTGTLDNISVRELPGNHAVQNTESARPILARVPETGRRNLLERTEEFDDAYWTKINVNVTANNTTDPLGGSSAERVGATNSLGNMQRAVTLAAASYTFSVYLKYSNSQWVRLGYINSATNAAWFDVQNGVKGSVNGAGNSSTIEDIGGGWYRCTLTIATASASSNIVFVSVSDADLSTASTIGESYYIWGAQLEASASATAYQKVVDQYDITEAGVTSLEYLAFDGSDDFMTAGTNADWNYLHDGTGCEFVIGLTPADAADTNALEGVFSTFSTDRNKVGASFGIEDRVAVANQVWSFSAARGVGGTSTFTARTANNITSLTQNYVVRGGHKSGETPEYFFYDDEVLEYSGSYDNTPSTANSQGPLNIGKIIDFGFYWSGNMFGLIIRNAQLTEDQRTNTSNYMASRTGITL